MLRNFFFAIFALCLAYEAITQDYSDRDKDLHKALLSSVELARVEEQWRDDIRKASDPYFAGRGEDSSQVIDFYAKWLREWLERNMVDKPRDQWQDWKNSFKSYYEETKPQVEEFLRQQYARYHERFENMDEAMQTMQNKASERLQALFEEPMAKRGQSEEKQEYEGILSAVEFEKFDQTWRDDVMQAAKNWLGDKAEDASDMVDFYSSWLQDWMHDTFVNKPAESWKDWKATFQSYYQGSKPQIERFLEKQYERAGYGADVIKTKVADAMEAMETMAVDRLEDMAKRFPGIAERTRVEL